MLCADQNHCDHTNLVRLKYRNFDGDVLYRCRGCGKTIKEYELKSDAQKAAKKEADLFIPYEK